MYEDSNFCRSLQTLAIIYLFGYNHSNGYEVVSHYGYGLYFSND